MECPRCGIDPGMTERCSCGYDLQIRLTLAQGERFRLFGTEFRGDTVIQSPASEAAKRHLWRSSMLAAATPVLLLAPLYWNQVSPIYWIGILAASSYGAWATYWGVLGVGAALTDYGERRARK